MSSLMKCLLKNLGQIQCDKVPQCFSWNQVLFNTLTWGQLCPSPYVFLSRQSHFPHPSQTSFEQMKATTFDRRRANNCSGCSPLILPLLPKSGKNAVHEITVNSQGYLNPFSPIVGFLSNNPTSHHNITWHLGIGEEHFVGAAIARLLSVRLSIGWLGDVIHGHGVNNRGAPWATAFTSTVPAKSVFQALACRKLLSQNLWKNISCNISCYFLIFSGIIFKCHKL